MKIRNPWIDPRVSEVRSAAARAYLLHHGWTPLANDETNFQEFESPSQDDNAPIIRVPLLEQGRDYSERMIEMITDLAVAEGRQAVAVLDDLLAANDLNGVPAPGSAKDASTAT